MMNIICIETQRLFRKRKYGMEVAALHWLQQLQKTKSTLQFKILVKAGEDECLQNSENVSIIKIPAKPYPVWEQFIMPGVAKKLKASLLHCTSNTAPVFTKLPLVVTIHDVIYMNKNEYSGSAYQNFGNKYRRLIVPRIARKAKAIITVSQFSKQEIMKALHIPDQKITVIYNGVNPQFKIAGNASKNNSFFDKYQIPKNYLLHFGNTATRKNTLGVLLGFKKYVAENENPVSLVISGCRKEVILDLLLQHNLQQIQAYLHLPEYIQQEDLPLLYENAIAFVCPSFSEGFGMPVIECMACGTPVITSNITSLPEIAGNAAILVDPYNHAEIGNAIQQLVTQPELVERLKLLGLQNVKRFNWENTVAETLKVYQSILNENK